MDWGQVVKISEYLGAILVIGGVIISMFVNLRKIVHVYDKMEELITNYDTTNKNIKSIKEDLKAELKTQTEAAEMRKELLLGVARQILLDRFNNVLDSEEISSSEFTVLSALYKSYTDNNGNSVIHDMWELVKQLPIKKK